MNTNIPFLANKARSASIVMSGISIDTRNNALDAMCNLLMQNKDLIVAANNADIEEGIRTNLSEPLLKRLKYDDEKIIESINGIKMLITLDDPVNKTVLKRQLDDGLVLEKITCPIGVIGVIFESRPDAFVQIASLCVKSGNSVILKGGSEAKNTNKILFETLQEAGISAGLPDGFISQIESREDTNLLFKMDEQIDLLIPRGSNEFVKYIMENSQIPVMGHADGVCHVYVDKKADIDMAVKIVIDSKTQYIAACNTLETLLVHKDIARDFLAALANTLSGVTLIGSEEVGNIIDCKQATEEDWNTEYLDYILSIKTVDSLEEAVEHINHYGSHHTDSIVTSDDAAAEKFMLLTDSASVYQNCSTRFADGFRYGFGAEVGISTGKLHARGPVGLDGLVTYKYKLRGDGHTVAPYSNNEKQFKFRDLLP